jgi:hypothetical protein
MNKGIFGMGVLKWCLEKKGSAQEQCLEKKGSAQETAGVLKW